MNTKITNSPSTTEPKRAAVGLSRLHQVKLPEADETFLESLAPRYAGSPRWQASKQKMTREVLAAAQITDRLALHWFDVTGDFRVMFDLRVTVPCLPDPRGPLRVADRATLALQYREEFLTSSQPGYVFISIIRPAAVWLANVAADFGQPLCLGPRIEAGTKVVELIVGSYLALSMQSHQYSQFDSAGVLRPEAATWWQHQKSHPIPLSKEPFVTQSILSQAKA
jgi:hypothetical protein